MKMEYYPKNREKMSYENFNVAIYCPVADIKDITDFEAFDKEFQLLEKNMKIGRVYLECYRTETWATKEQLLKVKKYFEDKGIATSGGITTCDNSEGMGYVSLCYSSEKGLGIIEKAVRLNAEVFDELIFDDFYFTNCRCEKCIEKKGDKSWSQFRLEQKRWVTEEIVMKVAKEVNPNINVIIKYPQWYEGYNETGYDLLTEPANFDTIYTGTETRNNAYAQQHLPKYLSYFIMRYLESAAPGRNLGGWFDPYECTYNLTSYLEQAYLTLFGKAKEATLFCLGSLMKDPSYRLFPGAVGELFAEVDKYLGKLGNPIGAVAYRPGYGRGEDNLHNYLGMCGIPLEGSITYPENAQTIFLTESSCADEDIIAKMKASMLKGADVVVTSGFVRKMGQAFQDAFVNVIYTSRKALVNEYLVSKNNGLTIEGRSLGDKKILIPQLDYYTNDVWELAGAYGRDNNFPVVLRCEYGKGTITVITIPDDMGDLYTYTPPVLKVIREVMGKAIPVKLDAPAGIMLFAYDNGTFIVRSDLPYVETVKVNISDADVKELKDLVYGRSLEVVNGQVEVTLQPGVNYVVKMVK